MWQVLTILSSMALLSLCKEYDPGVCDRSTHKKIKLVKDREMNEILVVCTKNHGNFSWKAVDGSQHPGEFFEPAFDCSDILNRKDDAKDGFYWINFDSSPANKVWCDMNTDGGGYMLIGRKRGASTLTVPSNNKTVEPDGDPHWSSAFGDAPILDFRIQMATKEDFAYTKAHWSYRLKTKRKLKYLLVTEQDGCDKGSAGIGNIAYVKDLQSERIVTAGLRCSKFGYGHSRRSPFIIGWKGMNFCLEKPCPKGFSFHPTIGAQLEYTGAFSFSTQENVSGIDHDATAFVGCDHNKCCGCYGPENGTKNYCSGKCQAINGGTVTKNVFTWFWLRSSLPRKAWKKCMEYKILESSRKFVWYKIPGGSSVPIKGRCGKNNALLYNGIVVVPDASSVKKIPPAQGLLAYRKDSKKLYIRANQAWHEIGQKDKILQEAEERVKPNLAKIDQKLKSQETNVNRQFNKLKQQLTKIDQQISTLFLSGCKDILSNHRNIPSGIYWIRPQGLSSRELRVYCDMVTHGGGWTLVYSYTFTNYQSFSSGSNAITPIPNWPASGANVPNSTIPPLDELSRGAVDYNLWKYIGKEFMVKSNINDWIVCKENGGSLVRKNNGGLSCKNIKNVAVKCQGVEPTKITWYSVGPALCTGSSFFYDFVGYTSDSDWPDHDPCGKGQANQKQGVQNPGGAIYLR